MDARPALKQSDGVFRYYVQREALLSDVVKTQSSLSEANHRYTQALMDLATAQADFETAIGRDR